MRILVIADIHANLTALEAVLKDARKRGGFDAVWCLGDIVGYGPDPHDCIALMQYAGAVCVPGNHDLSAIGELSVSCFNYEAAEAVHWTNSVLVVPEIAFLRNLPLSRVENGFTLVHGSPRDPVWTYVMTVNEAIESMKYFETAFCLVGHTHVPMYFEHPRCEFLMRPENSTKLKLEKNRWILNPGSVGQPRDGDPRAAYAVLEPEEKTITFLRVEYDIEAVQKRMEEAGLPEGLIYRLSRGR